MFSKLTFSLVFLFLCSCKSQSSKSVNELAKASDTIQIAMNSEPASLDPRLSRDLSTSTLLHMLYEGLMRLDYDGQTIPGIAREVTVSPDQKTYTFKLRPSFWSNGDPLTSEDIAKTWKSLLDPKFPAPNAYQFFVIKGAKEAKQGKIPLDEIGIQTPDTETLIVELEEETPYFLQLVSSHFFYPVHSKSTAENPIGNGPFKLEQWAHNDALTFVKNGHFWDASEVHLKKIIVSILDEQTALALFTNDELSWIGSPIGTLPQDAIATLKARHKLHIVPAAGVHWCRFNTNKSPFQNIQMRRAFALSIDRKAVVTHVTQGTQRPAMAVVPPTFGLPKKSFFEDHDSPMAWEAFQAALDEMNISKDELPEIVLSFAANDRNNKIAQAIQQQWLKGLGLTVKLKGEEVQLFLDHVKNGEYQIALGSWYADIHDPISFLDLFKSKDNPTNMTLWENPQYTSLLVKSSYEKEPQKRFAILSEAEELLMQDMPVAPLFFGAFNYVKKENLVGVYFSDLGTLDFTYAFYE